MKLCENNMDLVSVIMPAYNSARFIGDSIESVIAQSYRNWELLIVDDCSTDETETIVDKFIQTDSRVKYYKLDVNSGAAMARNKAIKEAEGVFISFLDSDDLWKKDKLIKQIKFMKNNNYNFTCTDRDLIDESSNPLNKILTVKEKVNYNWMLLLCPIGNSTVIYNANVLGKFNIPDIKQSNDYVLWLQILKKEKYVYGLNENLSSWRVVGLSLSSNKMGKLKHHWHIYRNIEGFSNLKSLFLILFWGLDKTFKIKKRLFSKRI